MTGKNRLAILGVLLLAGCTTSPAVSLLSKFGAENSPARFHVCRDYGCAKSVMVSLDETEWRQVRALFTPAPSSAADERERIRRAVALIEVLVGPKAGTQNDRAGAAIINFSRRGQQDCIDEAYNSSTYLGFLARDGLLRWHDVGAPARRGFFFDRWPHNTATVTERATGRRYVVDSWFHANGVLPEVVPLDVWLDGWHPPKGAQPTG
jgi:hypothetical protein